MAGVIYVYAVFGNDSFPILITVRLNKEDFFVFLLCD